VLVTGDIEFLAATESVLAFRRFDATQSVLAAVNLSPDPASITLPGISVARPLAGHGLPEGAFDDGTLTLPGHGVAFLQLSAP
jgi:alpha-glucosidase